MAETQKGGRGRINVAIPEDLHRRLKVWSDSTGIPVTRLVRVAVELHLKGVRLRRDRGDRREVADGLWELREKAQALVDAEDYGAAETDVVDAKRALRKTLKGSE